MGQIKEILQKYNSEFRVISLILHGLQIVLLSYILVRVYKNYYKTEATEIQIIKHRKEFIEATKLKLKLQLENVENLQKKK